MYENKTDDIPVKAVLACVDTGEFDAEVSIAELEELATTANADVVGSIIQKRPAYDSATCMGAGRLEELKEQLEALALSLSSSTTSLREFRCAISRRYWTSGLSTELH